MLKLKQNPIKILIIGIPKSGTTILTHKIASAFKNSHIYFEPDNKEGLNNIKLHRRFCEKNRKPVITKNLYYHNQTKSLPEIVSMYDKVIWIIRDPRDRVISEFFYRWNKQHNPIEERFKRCLSLVIKKEKSGNDISFFNILQGINNISPFRYIVNQVKLYNCFLQDIEEVIKDIFVYKYEDLIDNKFSKLEKYLGFSISQSTEVPEHLNRVVRSKAYGNWRNWFNDDDCLFFKGIYYEFLYKMGYDVEDWTLNNSQIIDPKEGSEYMKRMFKYIKQKND